MAPEIHSHAVFGFSENLDWTTLHFIKPFDDIRVCSACQAVARKTAFLACRHVLCEPCYEHWKSIGSHVCFLDGELCPENEVHWMEFPAEKMMRCEVTCWNRRNGCETITDVSSIAEHFHRDCAYHCTCCPKCLSTVLRRDILAHLESHCANYVLHRESITPHSEDISKDVQCLQEGLRALQTAFRKASQNDASLLSSLRDTTASNEDNQNTLLAMADELGQVSELTRQALSEADRSRERRVNQSVDLMNFGERLSAELHEIKRTTDEVSSCETATRHENMERQEHVRSLEFLQKEVAGISRKLEEALSKGYALTEVPSLRVRTSAVLIEHEGFKVEGIAHVIQNELKLPARVVWRFSNWSKITYHIKASNFLSCGIDVNVDDRYILCLEIISHPDDRRRFQFWPYMLEMRRGTLPASPKRIKLVFLNRGWKGVEHDLYRAKSGEFLTNRFGVEDLEGGGSLQDDRLAVCFRFFY